MTEEHPCPKCGRVLNVSSETIFYWFCEWCIEGWTTEELNGIRRFKEWLIEEKRLKEWIKK